MAQGSKPMAVNTHPVELKLVRGPDELELDLSPLQGLWTEQQYLKLTDQTRHLIEFTDGVIEVLPVPTDKHQSISQFLFLVLFSWVQPLGGTVHFAGLRMQIREGTFREPDLLLLLDANDPRRQDRFWLGADLVAEVVSPDDPERDIRVKRLDYAEAGIPEYWIANPEDETITVLTLAGAAYVEHGVFRRGQEASSVLLQGFAINVADVFDAN